MDRFLKKSNGDDICNTLTKQPTIDIGLDLLANNDKFTKKIFKKPTVVATSPMSVNEPTPTIEETKVIFDTSSNMMDCSNNTLLDKFRTVIVSKIHTFDPSHIQDHYDTLLQLLWYKYAVENVSETTYEN
jgi:hypothetical protein